MKNTMIAAGLALAMLLSLSAGAETKTFQSPSGNISLTLSDQGGLSYSLTGQGIQNLVSGRLGLDFADQKWPEDCRIAKVSEKALDETWELPLGIQKTYRDRCNEYAVTLEGDFPKRPVSLVFRLYDEGAALRYVVEAGQDDEYVIDGEKTDYLFASDYEAWYAPYGYRTSQEHISLKATVATIPGDKPVGCPLVIRDRNFVMALTETDLRDWAGLYFSSSQAIPGQVLAELGKLRGGEEAKAFEVDVTGLADVTLSHDSAGDNTSDHADWAALRLYDKDGNETKVTKEFVSEEKQGWGELHFDKSVDANGLEIGGRSFEDGFGGHATGFITLKLDKKYVKLTGFCGVDSEKSGAGLVKFDIIHKDLNAARPYVFAAPVPRMDGKGIVFTKGPRTSPWRLFLLGDSELDLVTNQMILNCAAPNAIGDTSWILPGRSTWNWWSDWNRNLCTESVKKEIDFASRHGWEYSTVDDPWYSPHMGRVGNNVMKGQEGRIDLEELASYAKSKGVKLILWMHWADIDRMMDEAFAYYEKLGIGGMKIDFMDRDDQEMVQWYEKTCQKAAKHHLVVNFHGSYKPSGFVRTYPNQITCEGVRGNETSKWDTEVNPKNLTHYPFTRYAQGPADLTPGGFLNRQPEDFQPTSPTQVIGTRAHELALCLVLPTPLLCLCDNPVNYEGQPGLEFLDQLKTTWDETIPVAGNMEEYYICARRSGAAWYVGMIGNDQPQARTLVLDFLAPGVTYDVQIFQDKEASDKDATAIDICTRHGVKKGDILAIKTVRNGGYNAILTPVKAAPAPAKCKAPAPAPAAVPAAWQGVDENGCPMDTPLM